MIDILNNYVICFDIKLNNFILLGILSVLFNIYLLVLQYYLKIIYYINKFLKG